MSKTWQIYYNAAFGALGGLLAWLVVGSISTAEWNLWTTYAFVGAGVGLFVGGVTGAVDGIVNKRALRPALAGAALGAAVGAVSGAVGLLLGGLGFLTLGGGILGRSLGWMLLGLLLGAGYGVVARSMLRTSYGAVGGALGGLVGGLLYETVTQLFLDRSDEVQIVVGGIGLIILGASLGGTLAFTIDRLAPGKLRVLRGRREGVEIDLLEAATLGSYDGCTLYLPDPGVAREHARLVRESGRFMLHVYDHGLDTRIDGKPVTPGAAAEVRKGQRIEMGQAIVELR